MTGSKCRGLHVPFLMVLIMAANFSSGASAQETPVPKPDISKNVVPPEKAPDSLPVATDTPLPAEKPSSPITKAVKDVASRLTKADEKAVSKEQPAKQKAAEKCDIPGLVYEKVAEITGPDACGIENPVRISGVGETIAFSAKADLSCAMAAKIKNWLGEDVRKAAKKHLKTELAGIRVAASYVCRRRNNKPDGKYSEHSFGKALDISFYRMQDGTSVSVKDDWRPEGPKRDFLQEIRKAACNRFTTVLTPDGDAYHQDHMHLDMGCHGKTCTYLICS